MNQRRNRFGSTFTAMAVVSAAATETEVVGTAERLRQAKLGAVPLDCARLAACSARRQRTASDWMKSPIWRSVLHSLTWEHQGAYLPITESPWFQ